jgi:hypothetical protein
MAAWRRSGTFRPGLGPAPFGLGAPSSSLRACSPSRPAPRAPRRVRAHGKREDASVVAYAGVPGDEVLALPRSRRTAARATVPALLQLLCSLQDGLGRASVCCQSLEVAEIGLFSDSRPRRSRERESAARPVRSRSALGAWSAWVTPCTHSRAYAREACMCFGRPALSY